LLIPVFSLLTHPVGIALFGHATVVASERVFAIVSIILILGVLLFTLPKVNWQYAQATTLAGSTTLGTWLLALSVIFAGPLSWVNYASDYSRYLPTSTSLKRVVLMSALGMAVATVAGALIGTVLATVVDMSNPIANLPKVLPGWYLVPFLLVVIWGAIANNVLNLYTAGLGLLALRIHAQRWIAVCIVASIAAALTYDVQGLHTWGRGPYWYRNGFNWSALVVYIIGIIASLAVANSTLWASPISTNYLGGADLSLFAGLIVTGVLYYLVGKKQIQKVPIQDSTQSIQSPSVVE
jgi:nucleobase:cation symporter-1, NCS1 family